MSFPQNTGSFVPVSNVWDISQVADLNIDPGLKELLVRLYQNINAISINLNLKDTGYYSQLEFVNGQLWFPDATATPSPSRPATYRQVFRKVINFGALPNAGAKSVAHGIPINVGYTFTRIYGCASDQVGLNYIPIPFSSPTLNQNIKIVVDATNVTITTAIDYTAYTNTYVVLEYLKF